MERRSPIALLTTFFTMLALSIFFNACNRMSGDIEPQNTKSPVAQKDSYARMSAYSCSQFIEPQVSQTQRSRAVSIYGGSGGVDFDHAVSIASTMTPGYVNNVGSLVFNYMNQISNAVRDGADDYANSFCDFCTTQTYSSYDLYTRINWYVGPIKNSIQTNPALTSSQRKILLDALSAFDYNFHYVSGLIENSSDCFEDPYWYNNGSLMMQRGFLSGLGRTLKKVVNIVATIVVSVWQFGVIFAVYGYLVGAFVSTIAPGIPTGLFGVAAGAVIGAFVGVMYGISRCINGDYVCIIGPCS